MSCHEDNNGKNESKNHNPLKHMLHLAICCGVSIVILAALPFIARYNPKAGVILAMIAPFLCPIIMLLMLPTMFGHMKKDNCSDKKNHQDDSSRSIESDKSAE